MLSLAIFLNRLAVILDIKLIFDFNLLPNEIPQHFVDFMDGLIPAYGGGSEFKEPTVQPSFLIRIGRG